MLHLAYQVLQLITLVAVVVLLEIQHQEMLVVLAVVVLLQIMQAVLYQELLTQEVAVVQVVHGEVVLEVQAVQA